MLRNIIIYFAILFALVAIIAYFNQPEPIVTYDVEEPDALRN